jgi:hypothetical protein
MLPISIPNNWNHRYDNHFQHTFAFSVGKGLDPESDSMARASGNTETQDVFGHLKVQK